VPKADFFQRLGLYAVDRFLDAEACGELREAVRAGSWRAGTVGNLDDLSFSVDSSVRSVKWVTVGDTMVSRVRERLLSLKPAVESHYQMALTDCEALQFLVYGAGDHYRPHRDHYDVQRDGVSDQTAAAWKVRRVSAVIFLNNQSERAAPNHYGGGALTFYDFFDDPSGKSLGIPLDADEGLLVTFPAGMLHGVTPVTHGERYTIATWFF